ncbi:hypothetical protein DPMN_070649 [Dreissena polymorpha]|uniref:Uncharacterized protein n=1 Tax=Dreissena polymorpha TaxID=45954 RepID=A0A9D3Z6K0_DREPO|nr:hypothetical protein DPMN_070649 [Dreissena polymorpha]
MRLLEPIDPHKDTGPDAILTRFTRETATEIAPAFTLVFAAILQPLSFDHCSFWFTLITYQTLLPQKLGCLLTTIFFTEGSRDHTMHQLLSTIWM